MKFNHLPFIFSLLLCFALPSSLSAATVLATTPTDSIIQTVSHLEGDEKLEALYQLVLSHNMMKDYPIFTKALEQESRKQKSDKYSAYSSYFRFFIYSNPLYTENTSLDTLELYAKEAIAAYDKANISKGRANVERVLVNYYLRSRNMSLALHRTQNYLQNVKNDFDKVMANYLLGCLYYTSGQGKEAAEAFRKSIEICTANFADDVFFRIHLYDSYQLIADTYIKYLEGASTALEYIDEYEKTLEKEEHPEIKAANIKFVQSMRVRAYLALKEYAKAKPLLDEMAEVLKEVKFMSDADINSMYGAYYIGTGEYDKALPIVEKALLDSRESGSIHNFMILHKQKADALDGLHRYREAGEVKSEIIAMTDSLNMEQGTRQLTEMQTLYEVSRIEAEKEQGRLKLQQSYLIIGGISIIVLLLIVLFVVEKRNSKRLQQKNLKLFEQYRHITLLNGSGIPVATGTSGIHPAQDEEEKEKEGEKEDDADAPNKQDIFNKALEYLLDSEEYLNNDLDRRNLALKIGTNRQYLIEAIQECMQMTFSEFIMYLQLEHARKMLLQNSSIKIETVLQLSGFNNSSTFYRHFNNRYGMSPAEFRKMAKGGVRCGV